MISAVIPVFNEQDTLETLFNELSRVAGERKIDLEVVFVDDGSTDASWQRIEQLAVGDERVRGIRFRRNFGKAAALDAGFATARGSIILTLDADLQDDPHEIPKFLDLLEQGFDVVSGWKKVRHDPWHKVFPSRIFNALVSRMTGVALHDHNCGFKAYRREIFDEIRLYGELHRFVPVLAASHGWKVTETEVHHRPREHGRSKYGWVRIPKGLLDLLTVTFLTGYGQRPQHLLGAVGLIGFSLGLFGMFLLAAWWALSRTVSGWIPVHLHERPIFYYSLGAVLVGSQFLAVGLLAELVTSINSREHPPYSIASRVGPKP